MSDTPVQKLIREMALLSRPPFSKEPGPTDDFARQLFTVFQRTAEHSVRAAEGLAILNKMTQMCVAAHEAASAIEARDRDRCLAAVPDLSPAGMMEAAASAAAAAVDAALPSALSAAHPRDGDEDGENSGRTNQ